MDKNNHSFEQKIRESKSPERIRKDLAIIERTFDNVLAVFPYNIDGNDKGIDYVVAFNDKTFVTVDIKTREKGVSAYWKDTGYKDSEGKSRKMPELTLEIWSNKEEKKVGWTLDEDKVTDYVIYAFDSEDAENTYAFDSRELRETFKTNFRDWVRDYGVKECMTDGKYTTVSCFVPFPVVKEGIGDLNKFQAESKINKMIVRGGNRL